MVEVMLISEVDGQFRTTFFDGRYTKVWPAETFATLDNMRLLTKEALQSYRDTYAEVETARQDYNHSKL